MEVTKLNRRGQLSIPKAILKALGLKGEVYFLIEATPDGAIVMRPAGVYPLEVYTEEQVREFLESDTPTAEEIESVQRLQHEILS